MKYSCCESSSGEVSGTITCMKCSKNYHHQCLFPSVKHNKDLNQEFKKTWLCPQCIVKQPKQVKNDNTPIRGTDAGSSKTNYSENVNCRRGGAVPPKAKDRAQTVTGDENCSGNLEHIKQYLSEELAKIKSELETSIVNKITSEFRAVKDEISSIKSSLDFMNDQYEQFKKRMDSFDSNLKSLSAKTSEIGELRSSLDIIEKDNNSREQWARRSNIEIIGVPQKKDENLMNVVKSIAELANYRLDPSVDIDFVTRVAPKSKSDENKKSKPIVVRFLSRWKKDDFMSHAKKLKLRGVDVGFTNTNNPIHLNDHLTSSNKALLQATKKLGREKGYAYVWVKNCTIMVRRSDTSPVLHILQSSDLKKIV